MHGRGDAVCLKTILVYHLQTLPKLQLYKQNLQTLSILHPTRRVTVSPQTSIQMAPQDMKIPPRSGDVPDDGDSDLGDFVTTEEEEGDIEYYCEDSSRYNSEASRAFYPICIGEILSDRYRIDHKLGHGGFSTVWLAYDLEKKTVVALKVTDSSEKGKYEAQIPEEIIRRVKDTSHVLTYLRAFSLQVEASNRHQVLVFPWVGECLTFPKLEKLSMASRMLAAR